MITRDNMSPAVKKIVVGLEEDITQLLRNLVEEGYRKFKLRYWSKKKLLEIRAWKVKKPYEEARMLG